MSSHGRDHESRDEAASRTKMLAFVGIAALAIVGVAAWLLMGSFNGPATVTSGVPLAAVPASASPPARTTAAATPASIPPAANPVVSNSPSTIGTSVDGVAIRAYRFGSGGTRYLVVGGIHGDEYGAAVGEALVSKLAADPSLVPQDAEIDVIPVLNPDGRTADTRANAHGVDLNRNFPSKDWRRVLAPGDSSAQRGFNGGSGPGSEPETKALLKYLANGFNDVVTLHSRGGIVDYDGPGGLALARRVSAIIGLPVSHLAYQPSIHGSMGIYVPEKYHIPVITLELSSKRLTKPVLDGILSAASPN